MAVNPHHINEVRIIAGSHRSRRVKFPPQIALRPTPDRVREQLFNWLGQNLCGQKVLDLFAGSAVLAFEAASRGAAAVVAVENNTLICRAVRANIKKLGLGGIELRQAAAFDFLTASRDKFDLVFLDPPYIWNDWQILWQLLAEHLTPSAQVYIESNRAIALPYYLDINKTDSSGSSQYLLATKKIAGK